MDCGQPGSSVHGESPGKNTGVGCHVLLQGIIPTQGSNQVSHIAGGFFTTEPPEAGTQQTPHKDHTGAGVPPIHPTALPPEPSTQQEHNKHQLNK